MKNCYGHVPVTSGKWIKKEVFLYYKSMCDCFAKIIFLFSYLESSDIGVCSLAIFNASASIISHMSKNRSYRLVDTNPTWDNLRHWKSGTKFSDWSINQDSFFMDSLLWTRACLTCIQVERETWTRKKRGAIKNNCGTVLPRKFILKAVTLVFVRFVFDLYFTCE